MFRTNVSLTGPSSQEEFAAQLAQLVAPPFALSKAERRKPLRGKFTAAGGSIRWSLNEYRFVSQRNLHFHLKPSDKGTILEGQFVSWLGYRIIVIAWLVCGIGLQLEQLIVPGLIYHAGLRFDLQKLLFILIGLCMAGGYTWLIVKVGGRRDQELIRVLRNVLAGPAQAGVVRDLFIR